MKWKTTACILMLTYLGQQPLGPQKFMSKISSALHNLIDPTLPIMINDQPFNQDLNHLGDKYMIHGPTPHYGACLPVGQFWNRFGGKIGAKSLADLKIKRPDSIGKGNFGEVIPCGNDASPVAFKYTKFKIDSSEGKTINTEMKTYAKVGNHPSIARAYGCYILGDHGGMLMESLGSPLNKKANFMNGLDAPKKASIYKKIGEGYDYIHKKGLCHNDIKPDNILQSREDEHLFKIIDFGISCVINMPCSGNFLSFAAPEKFVPNGPFICTPSADVWAYALTIYCIETSQQDFDLPQRIAGCPTANSPQCVSILRKKLMSELEKSPNPFLRLVRKVLSLPRQKRNSMQIILNGLSNIASGRRSSAQAGQKSRSSGQMAQHHNRISAGNMQQRGVKRKISDHRRSSGLERGSTNQRISKMMRPNRKLPHL